MNKTFTRLMRFILIIGVMALGAVSGLAIDRHVVQNAPTPGNGYTNWNCAAGSIQEAIDAAVDGDTVWVTNGTYGTPPTPIFANDATNMVNINKRIRVRSVSDNPADTIIDAGGGINNRCVRIDTTIAGDLSPPFRISGFTLTNGYAKGGGLWVEVYSPVRTAIVDRCVIAGNRGISGAGGVYNYFYGNCATLILSNVVIRGNLNGGMFKGNHGKTIVTGCQFEDNEANGLSLQWGDNLVENCTFTGNRSTGVYGGALLLNPTYDMVVRNCLFARNELIHAPYNTFTIGGAAIGVATLTQAKFYNCTVVSNTAVGYGALRGGIYLHQSSTGMVWNCIMRENYTLDRGIMNVSNYGSGGGGSPLFVISNSCTTPITGYLNAGNLNADPQFVDFAGEDFHLKRTSPCLNTGTNQAWMSSAKDLAGNQRLDMLHGLVDMGCYEYVYKLGTTILVR